MTAPESLFHALPPIEGKAYCSCGCGARASHAPLSAVVHPGFGAVACTRDGAYGGCALDDDESATFQDYESVAAADPDHDWRIRIDGPLSDYTYQRQGEGKWVLVEQRPGFA